MWLILSELTSRLLLYWKNHDPAKDKEASSPTSSPSSSRSPSSTSRDFRVTFTDDLPFQEYFALIDAHFQCRKQLEIMRDTLEKQASQFRAIQKRLLVRNAVPLSSMDLLLENTYEDISQMTSKIQAQQKTTKAAACNLSCATQLVQRLIRYKFNLDDTTRVNDSHSDQQQGWEESTDASLVQLLRTVLAASAQDMATLPVLTSLPDTHTLQQHVIMVTDRLAQGGKLYKPSSSTSGSRDKKKSSSSTSTSEKGGSPKAKSSRPRDK